jgi:cation-transporting ATPase E
MKPAEMQHSLINSQRKHDAGAQITGLSTSEVTNRRRNGQGNNIKLETSRSYRDIIVTNVFNVINVILFAIGAVMIFIGRISDAVTSVGLIVLNVIIGVYQEIRAKRQLDRIALLTRPKVNVIRDSHEQVIDPSELVLGDVIVVRAGDQFVVDGVVVGGKIDVDESLLTGESDLIPKEDGDELLSGSFCVAGTAMYEATRVGNDSFANKLTANARQFQIAYTPLQREINFILRLLMLLAGFIGFLVLIGTILSEVPFMRQVQIAAVIAGLVPNGLFFMVILAYAMGALRIVQRGALVQQSNAVESLSNVTVLCTDKTGTLTANRINYHDVFPVGIEKADLERLLGDFAHSASANNKTGEALVASLKGAKRSCADEVPFSSARKWSALAFDEPGLRGVYVLGALEMLQDHLSIDEAAQQQLTAWSDEGLRVLVCACNPDIIMLHDDKGEPSLPELRLLGLVSFSDELRPHLRETMAEFATNGIQLKVISGDNPQTVAALARQAGLPGELQYVSGPELALMSDDEFKRAANEKTIFGRITPSQKEALVEALHEQGHYVAMIGDGVNDVLSLKKADMSIAMESGSSATRAVADMILLGDSFEALPPAFTEGQRIINGMKDILRLFLTRVVYSALLIIAVAIIGLGFPFLPTQTALLSFLTVGLPTLALAMWARPGPLPRRSILREIAHFVVPASASIFFFGLFIYIIAFFLSAAELIDFNVTPEAIESFERYTDIDYDISTKDAFILEVSQLIAQTSLTAFIVFSGVILLIFVEPPIEWFVGGDDLSGDWRPTMIAGVMLAGFVVTALFEPLRQFFGLIALPFPAYMLIGIATVIWMLVLRRAWRKRWLQRFLEVDF